VARHQLRATPAQSNRMWMTGGFKCLFAASHICNPRSRHSVAQEFNIKMRIKLINYPLSSPEIPHFKLSEIAETSASKN
jgi:hypothetical protein